MKARVKMIRDMDAEQEENFHKRFGKPKPKRTLDHSHADWKAAMKASLKEHGKLEHHKD